VKDLKELYSGIIKAHNVAPYHFEKIANPTFTVKAYNPTCGDRFELFLNLNGQKIEQVHFHGFGCAISKASTSVIARSIEGKTIDEAKAICKKFVQFINKESSFDTLTLSDEFLAFERVHDFPERYDCATLSGRELEKYLETLK